MKRIGILGGTFDPPHIGHMIIARTAMEQFGLCEVLIMTGGNPPHKDGDHITPAEVRHAMVRLAAEGEPRLVPFDFEVHKETYSYTAETITELKKQNPDTEYYFIIGEDSLNDIVKWYRPDIIAQNCVLLVYPRGTSSQLEELIEERKKTLNADIRIIASPVFGISSTEIRERVKCGKSIKYLVPDAVERYIRVNKLYCEEK